MLSEVRQRLPNIAVDVQASLAKDIPRILMDPLQRICQVLRIMFFEF